MAPFEILKGKFVNLPVQLSDGKLYFCVDTGEIYLDTKFDDGIVQRIKCSNYDTEISNLNALIGNIDTALTRINGI